MSDSTQSSLPIFSQLPPRPSILSSPPPALSSSVHHYEQFRFGRGSVFVYTRGCFSRDSLSLYIFEPRQSLYAYSYVGSISSLNRMINVEPATYASWLLSALSRSNTVASPDLDCKYRLTEDASNPTRATLSIDKQFGEVWATVADVPLTVAIGRAALEPELAMLGVLKERLTEMQQHRQARVPVREERQKYADLLQRMLDDESTGVPAVERRLLEGCRRLLNAEKEKIRQARRRNERLREEIETLRNPPPPPSPERPREERRRRSLLGDDTESDTDDSQDEDQALMHSPERMDEDEKGEEKKEEKEEKSFRMEFDRDGAEEPHGLVDSLGASPVDVTQGIDLSFPITSAPSFVSVSSAGTTIPPLDRPTPPRPARPPAPAPRAMPLSFGNSLFPSTTPAVRPRARLPPSAPSSSSPAVAPLPSVPGFSATSAVAQRGSQMADASLAPPPAAATDRRVRAEATDMLQQLE